MDSLVFAPDFLHLDFLISMHSFTCCGSPMPLLRALNVEPSSLLLDPALFDPPMSPRSFGCLGLALPALDLLHLGFSMSAQCFCRTGLALSVFGKFSFGESSISVLGRVMFGPSLLVQSSSHFGSTISVLDFIHVDLVLPLRSATCCSSSTPVWGQVCLGSSLLVLDAAHMAPPLLLQAFVWSASSLPIIDMLRLGFPMFLQGFA